MQRIACHEEIQYNVLPRQLLQLTVHTAVPGHMQPWVVMYSPYTSKLNSRGKLLYMLNTQLLNFDYQILKLVEHSCHPYIFCKYNLHSVSIAWFVYINARPTAPSDMSQGNRNRSGRSGCRRTNIWQTNPHTNAV